MSVRIHKADGKFEEERTYPRSADPTLAGARPVGPRRRE